MKRKQLSAQRSFSVLVLTIIIFALGILVGNLLSAEKVDSVVELTQQLQIRTLSSEVELDILQENICTSDSALFLTRDLVELGARVEFMENQLGFDDDRIIELKEQYFIVQAKHWLLAKNRVETCLENAPSINETVIIYFYSNQGDCPRCQQQGTVLTYLQTLYDGMKVYSFDITSDTPAVQTIKRVYGITDEELPVLIVNNEVEAGLNDVDKIIGVVRLQQQAANSTANPETNTTEINGTVLGDSQGNVFIGFSEN